MADTTVYTPEEVERRLAELSGWRLEGPVIAKKFAFASFMEAISFVRRVADAAETADHHPDILINYKRVTCSLATHSAGGITDKDFNLAAAISRLA